MIISGKGDGGELGNSGRGCFKCITSIKPSRRSSVREQECLYAVAVFGLLGAGCGQDMPGLDELGRLSPSCCCGSPCGFQQVKPGQSDSWELSVNSPQERQLLVSHSPGCDGKRLLDNRLSDGDGFSSHIRTLRRL